MKHGWRNTSPKNIFEWPMYILKKDSPRFEIKEMKFNEMKMKIKTTISNNIDPLE